MKYAIRCEAEIIHELGYIEEHKKRNDFMQFSYCFVATARNRNSVPKLSENERSSNL
jgi:8-oxo-dGTP diphosphatase